MKSSDRERILGIYLSAGATLVTLVVAINTVTDPVNAPKLFVLGALGFGVLFILLNNQIFKRVRETPAIYLGAIVFLVFSLLTTFLSSSPFSQNLYGVYGRNNGLLTYTFLTFVMIAASQLREQQSFTFIVVGFFVAGFGNLIYSTWSILFGDFLPWSNPYGNILGTFGNPNFIGSFFGMFIGALVSQLFNLGISNKTKIFLAASLPVLIFVTYKSHAIQGRVIAISSIAIVLFFKIRERFSRRSLGVYMITITTVGIFALAGALQKGPLTSIIYKTSVSLRGQYWAAGLNTGEANLWTGVGFDGFGDWYRRSREIRALVLPGPNTVVNASHNVPVDIFAFGGILLFAAYLLLILITLGSCYKFIAANKKFDATFVTLFTIWIGYQLQSIISINQIGLAIWGWLLSGALVGYSFAKSINQSSSGDVKLPKGSKHRSQTVISSGVLGGVGVLIGALISVPPLSADMKWRSAQITGDVRQILATLDSGYLNPQNTYRFLNVAIALESSNFNDEALAVTKQAISFNPDSFETWRLAYYLKAASSELKNKALINMKRLDPLNPNVTVIE